MRDVIVDGQVVATVPDDATQDEVNSIIQQLQVDTPQNISAASAPPVMSQEQLGNLIGGLANQARSGQMVAAPFINPSDLQPTRRQTSAEADFENQVEGAADFGMRAKLGLASSVDQKANFLVREFGADNVRAIDNRLFFRPTPDQPFSELDPNRLDTGDIADLSGASVVAVPAIAGEIAAGPPGAAAGAVVGDVARQGLANAFGVQDGFEPLDSIKEGGFALVGAGLFGAPSRVIDTAASVPAAIAPAAARRAEATPSGVASRQVEREIGAGQLLTTGEATGSTVFSVVEDYLRTSPKSADIADSFQVRRLESITNRLDNIIGDTTRESAGRRVGAVFQEGVRRAVDVRSSNFRRSLREAFESSGGQANIPVSNVRSEVDRLIDDLDTGFGDAGVNNLSNVLRSRFSNDANAINAKQLQNSMKEFGDMANGGGNLIPEITDRKTRSAVGSRVLTALRNDLNEAIESGVEGADILRGARDQFAADSRLVDEYKSSVLAKVAGVDQFTPEKVVNKIRNSEPTEIRRIAGTLRALDEGSISDLGKVFVADILDKSRSSVGDIGASVPNISYAKFSTEFNKNKLKMQEIMTPREFREIENIAKVASRIKGSLGVSPTATRQEARQSIDLIGSGAKGVVTFLVQRQTARQTAEMLFNEEARGAASILFRAFTNNRGTSKKALESIGVLTQLGFLSPTIRASSNELEEGQEPGI